MEANLGKPVVLDKPNRGVELKTYTFPQDGAGSNVEYYEGWVNDKRYLIPDTKLEDMKNFINTKIVRTDDPKSIFRDFDKPKEERRDHYKEKLRKLSARLRSLEDLGYIEKKESPLKEKLKINWNKRKRKSAMDINKKRTRSAGVIVINTKLDISNNSKKLPDTRTAKTEKVIKPEGPMRRKTRFQKISIDSRSSHEKPCLCVYCIWSWVKKCCSSAWQKVCHCFNKRRDG